MRIAVASTIVLLSAGTTLAQTRDLVPTDPAGVALLPFLAVSADGKSYAYSFIRNLSELYLIEGLK